MFGLACSTGKENVMSYGERKMGIEEYIALNEGDPEHRYEYIDGDVFKRPHMTLRHAIISTHIAGILGTLLEDSPDVVYNSMAWVHLANTGYVYPDVTVSHDPLPDDDEQTVTNPCMVVET